MALNTILRRLFGFDTSSSFLSYYFALGDSISTDDYPGEGKGAASLLYKNQDHLYPDFRGKDLLSLNKKISFQCLAKDGATSHDVLHSQMKSLRHGTWKSGLFTLTAGGNDILSLQSDSEEIIFRIQTILEIIQRLFPNSVTLLGTIYDPTDGTADLFGQGIPLERELEILMKTNNAIRSMADQERVYVVDIYEHFLGHGTKAAMQENPEMGNDSSVWYVMAIEPNSRGAHEIRNLFWKALGQYLLDSNLAKQDSGKSEV